MAPSRTDFVAAVLGLFVLGLLVLLPAASAGAHSDLVSSFPAADARVDAPPDQITLEFAGPMALAEDGIEVRGPDGEVLAATVLGSATSDVFLAVLEPGAPAGVWTVEYDGLSLDGHRVLGSFSFVSGDVVLGAAAGPEGGRTAAGTAVLLLTLATGFVVVARVLAPSVGAQR